jgi:quinol monooxygenase YgiN
MSDHVKIMAILAARPGKADELRTLLDGMVASSRSERGNLHYDLWQDQTDPARFVLDELYADNAAVAAHRATPHFQNYLSVIGDLAERTALVLDPAVVA